MQCNFDNDVIGSSMKSSEIIQAERLATVQFPVTLPCLIAGSTRMRGSQPTDEQVSRRSPVWRTPRHD